MSSLLCLALAIFHEARGEPTDVARYAVAEVVINRAKERDKTICQVIAEPNQFSWYRRKGLNLPKSNVVWEDSIKIAEKSLRQKTNYTNGSTYFNTLKIGVRFGKKRKAVIHNHVFY